MVGVQAPIRGFVHHPFPLQYGPGAGPEQSIRRSSERGGWFVLSSHNGSVHHSLFTNSIFFFSWRSALFHQKIATEGVRLLYGSSFAVADFLLSFLPLFLCSSRRSPTFPRISRLESSSPSPSPLSPPPLARPEASTQLPFPSSTPSLRFEGGNRSNRSSSTLPSIPQRITGSSPRGSRTGERSFVSLDVSLWISEQDSETKETRSTSVHPSLPPLSFPPTLSPSTVSPSSTSTFLILSSPFSHGSIPLPSPCNPSVDPSTRKETRAGEPFSPSLNGIESPTSTSESITVISSPPFHQIPSLPLPSEQPRLAFSLSSVEREEPSRRIGRPFSRSSTRFALA